MNLPPPDLSPCGMFSSTSSEFPEGATVKLRLHLSRSSYLIEACPEARYCLRRVSIGVEFIEIVRQAVRAIEKEISNVA